VTACCGCFEHTLPDITYSAIQNFWIKKAYTVYRIPDQINADYLNSVRHEISAHFRNKKSENLKGKIISLKQTEPKL